MYVAWGGLAVDGDASAYRTGPAGQRQASGGGVERSVSNRMGGMLLAVPTPEHPLNCIHVGASLNRPSQAQQQGAEPARATR